MRRITPRAAPILLVSVLAPLYSQQVTTWQDPSPHAVQFVTVENDVRLEVLDWGGASRPIVLLAGGGVEFGGNPASGPGPASECDRLRQLWCAAELVHMSEWIALSRGRVSPELGFDAGRTGWQAPQFSWLSDIGCIVDGR